jgi:hypothetical protein
MKKRKIPYFFSDAWFIVRAMKKIHAFEIYGVKKAFALYLTASLLSFLGSLFLALYSYFLQAPWGYLFAGFFFLLGAYVFYLSLYQGHFRYARFLASNAIPVEAILSHFDEKGQITIYYQAEAMVQGKLVSGRLYGTFDRSFFKEYDDGSKLLCLYLPSGEFLALNRQKEN